VPVFSGVDGLCFDVSRYAKPGTKKKYDAFNIHEFIYYNYVIVFYGYLHSFWCVKVIGRHM
jgi:hypothetical protein